MNPEETMNHEEAMNLKSVNRGPYPLWLRCWHWSNAVLVVTLLITGLSMHYSEIGPPRLAFRRNVLIHNTAGILLTLFYFLFLFGNMRLGNGRYSRIFAGDLHPGLLRQALYYVWGIFVGSPHPYPHSETRKFNPLQNLFYLAVMYLLFPFITVTGWALLFPERLPREMFGAPGISWWALSHTYFGWALSLFMVVHIYLGTTGTTPGELYRFMWSGSHRRTASPVHTTVHATVHATVQTSDALQPIDRSERAGSPESHVDVQP